MTQALQASSMLRPARCQGGDAYLQRGIGRHELCILCRQVLLPQESVLVKGSQVLPDDHLGPLNAACQEQQDQCNALVAGNHVKVGGGSLSLCRHDRQLLGALQHLQDTNTL